MKDHFWELRFELFDSHVDNKHEGFYKSKKKLKKEIRAQKKVKGVRQNGRFYKVRHNFDD